MTTESTTSPSPYPEHEKLSKVKDRSQAVGEFLDWASSERGYLLCEAIGDKDSPHWPITVPTEKLLADFFGINLDRLEKEKRAMLEEQRALNERTKNAG